MKPIDDQAKLKRQLSGIRLGFYGTMVLALAFVLWAARDTIPELATTRVVATALVTLWHGGDEAALMRAFAAAQANSAVEATIERDPPKPNAKAADWSLRITADTPERAKAELAALCDAVTAAVPEAPRYLMVSQNNSTAGAPNTASRRLALAVHAGVMLLLFGGQFLIVIGAWREGETRLGMLASVAAPFALLIFASDSPGRGHPGARGTPITVDWQFVLLALVLTTIPLLLGLYLTRRKPSSPRRAGS